MHTSRNAVIVCDSDIGGKRSVIKERVARLKQKLDATPKLHDRIMVWITNGREIENYVPQELFEEVFCSKIPHRQRFEYLGRMKKLPSPDRSFLLKGFGLSDSFDEYFAQLYLRKIDRRNKKYASALIKNISSSVDKIKVAKEVTKLWNEQTVYKYDLKNKIDQIFSLIESGSSI